MENNYSKASITNLEGCKLFCVKDGKFLFLFIIITCGMCMRGGENGGCIHHVMAHSQRSEHNFQEQVLSFRHGIWTLDSGQQDCVASVRYPPSLLTGSFLNGLKIRNIHPSFSAQTVEASFVSKDIRQHVQIETVKLVVLA